MVNAGIEVDVVHCGFLNGGIALVLKHPAESSPVVRHGTTPMRDDDFQCWEVFEYIRENQLLKARGIGT